MKKFKVEANELLQRNELKSVFGGYANDEGEDNCVDLCSSNSDCGPPELDESCMTIVFTNGCRAKRCVRNFE